MKILCAEYNPEGVATIVPVGDNALLRNNDDFYFPDFTAALNCVPQYVVRISRLGKSIQERYAGRYYDEVGLGIRFYADSLEEHLRKNGLPEILASAFDGSAAISPLVAVDRMENWNYDFRVNGAQVFHGIVENPSTTIARLVAFASEYYTLKIGDFLYCGNLFCYKGLQLGDRLQMSLEGKEMFDFKIK